VGSTISEVGLITNKNYLLHMVEHTTSLGARHTSDRQPHAIKFLCAQRDLRYGDFGFHLMVKTGSGNSLVMT
jgi:hypothetical protein